MAAVNGHAQAGLLVDVTALGASTGAGLVAATPKHVPLTGGLDAALPLNTPVLVTKRTEAERFGADGTIPAALDGI
ncbi:hypothetical protein, partial [Thiocapsa sp.]|uniref:hypothetical protein n=1 Tax=Thiocapsa sp. TaxID=2024551 RepID=UPI0025E1D2BE